MMKNIFILLIFLFLTACSSKTLMDKPIQFKNPSGFFHALAKLEGELSKENYLALTDAVGFLKVSDTNTNSLDDFYSGFSGLTPKQIILKANELK
jgi:hypothetical protein